MTSDDHRIKLVTRVYVAVGYCPVSGYDDHYIILVCNNKNPFSARIARTIFLLFIENVLPTTVHSIETTGRIGDSRKLRGTWESR